MPSEHTIDQRTRELEVRLEDLRDHVIKPPKPHWTKRLLGWDMARNVMILLGIPTGLWGLYTLINEEFVRYDEIEKLTR